MAEGQTIEVRLAVVAVAVGAVHTVAELGEVEVRTVPPLPAAAQKDVGGQLTELSVLLVPTCDCCVLIPLVSAVGL